MRALRVILIIAVVMVSILGLLWFLPMFQPHYIRLQHKSPEYYAELTQTMMPPLRGSGKANQCAAGNGGIALLLQIQLLRRAVPEQ